MHFEYHAPSRNYFLQKKSAPAVKTCTSLFSSDIDIRWTLFLFVLPNRSMSRCLINMSKGKLHIEGGTWLALRKESSEPSPPLCGLALMNIQKLAPSSLWDGGALHFCTEEIVFFVLATSPILPHTSIISNIYAPDLHLNKLVHVLLEICT